MMPLFDMLNNAQNGEAMRGMAKQFGLDENQMNKTIEALMPAFSTGLKRNTQTPDAMGSFMKALSSGNHAQYFEDISKAASPAGMADGNNILGHLFGSKDVSRAVATQAEAATGVGQDIIKQLLPVLATTIMGGMFNQTNDSMKAMSGGSGNVFGDLMSQMMGAGQGAQQSASNNPFGDLMGQMMGAGQSGAQNNPLGQILGGLMGGGQSGAQNNAQNNPFGQMMEGMFGGAAQQKQPEAAPANPYDELFGKMFDTGRTVQDEYQKNVDNIFDQYLGGMNKK